MINRPVGSPAARVVTIKLYRREISALERAQDQLFKKACKLLKIKGEPQITQLFDFLFNGGFGDVKTPAQLEKQLWHATDAVKPSETMVEQ